MTKPITDEELAEAIVNADGDYEATLDLIKSYAKDYAENEKLGLIDKLNKDMFYSEANPSGQHVKNCLMAEYDALQRERIK